MPIPEVEEILAKYKKEEEKINDLFKETVNKQEEIKIESEERPKLLSYEEAKERNKKILKDLETVKGNLRSKAIFSPTEMKWEEICTRYQEEPSLPVTKWKCNVPIFV